MPTPFDPPAAPTAPEIAVPEVLKHLRVDVKQLLACEGHVPAPVFRRIAAAAYRMDLAASDLGLAREALIDREADQRRTRPLPYP